MMSLSLYPGSPPRGEKRKEGEPVISPSADTEALQPPPPPQSATLAALGRRARSASRDRSHISRSTSSSQTDLSTGAEVEGETDFAPFSAAGAILPMAWLSGTLAVSGRGRSPSRRKTSEPVVADREAVEGRMVRAPPRLAVFPFSRSKFRRSLLEMRSPRRSHPK